MSKRKKTSIFSKGLLVLSVISSLMTLWQFWRQHTAPLTVQCMEEEIAFAQGSGGERTSLDEFRLADSPAEITEVTKIELQNGGDGDIAIKSIEFAGMRRLLQSIAVYRLATAKEKVLTNQLKNNLDKANSHLEISNFPTLKPTEQLIIYLFADRFSLTECGGIIVKSNASKLSWKTIHRTSGIAWLYANFGLWIIIYIFAVASWQLAQKWAIF